LFVEHVNGLGVALAAAIERANRVRSLALIPTT
jgi:hypothetical protein